MGANRQIQHIGKCREALLLVLAQGIIIEIYFT